MSGNRIWNRYFYRDVCKVCVRVLRAVAIQSVLAVVMWRSTIRTRDAFRILLTRDPPYSNKRKNRIIISRIKTRKKERDGEKRGMAIFKILHFALLSRILEFSRYNIIKQQFFSFYSKTDVHISVPGKFLRLGLQIAPSGCMHDGPKRMQSVPPSPLALSISPCRSDLNCGLT